jgi:hypothetical protein
MTAPLNARHALLLKQAAEQRKSYGIAQKAKSHTRAQRALEQAQRLELEAAEIEAEIERDRADAARLLLPDMSDAELIATLAESLCALPLPLLEGVLVEVVAQAGDGPLRRALTPLRLVRGDE